MLIRHIMKKLKRSSFNFTVEGLKFLKDTSNEIGISVSELLRRIIDEYKNKYKKYK